MRLRLISEHFVRRREIVDVIWVGHFELSCRTIDLTVLYLEFLTCCVILPFTLGSCWPRDISSSATLPACTDFITTDEYLLYTHLMVADIPAR